VPTPSSGVPGECSAARPQDTAQDGQFIRTSLPGMVRRCAPAGSVTG